MCDSCGNPEKTIWTDHHYRNYIVSLGKARDTPYQIAIFADNHGVCNSSFFEREYGHPYDPRCYTYAYGGSEPMTSWNRETAILLGEVMIDNIINKKMQQEQKDEPPEVDIMSSWLKK